MFKVEGYLKFEDLTEEEQESGIGADDDDDGTRYIRITDHKGSRLYHDAIEPEDATFKRDLSWIVGELKVAYNAGKIDQL